MKTGAPRKRPGAPRKRRKPGPKPGQKMWDLFTEAHAKHKHRWVNIEVYTSNYAYRVRREIMRGEVDVPGGADAWEIRAVTTYNDDDEKTGSELWARRRPIKKT